MSVSARAVVMDMFRYGQWVVERLSASLHQAGLTDHERVVWIVNHVTNARRIWLERTRDGKISTSMAETLSLDESVRRCDDDTAAWIAWLDALPGDDLDHVVAYANLRGDQFEQPLYQIVFHVVNHTTHHLHEIGTILRANGHVPPPTDYIVYTRT